MQAGLHRLPGHAKPLRYFVYGQFLDIPEQHHFPVGIRQGLDGHSQIQAQILQGHFREALLMRHRIQVYPAESKAGQPAPLIDKLHRLMALFQRNQAADVQRFYEEWGLASEPLVAADIE